MTGNAKAMPAGGLAGWLLGRLRAGRRREPRLAVLERIALAPRQSLTLVEAEGRRFLVATSPEGTPAFYALDGVGRRKGAGSTNRDGQARVSW
jgi:flagellar biogenesis protein FliO